MTDTSTLESINVLIVEDQSITRTALSAGLLSKGEHLCVSEAENGEQALLMIREKQPDVVLMDIYMPVMDGLETTQAIKQEFGDAVKVVMLTSSNDEKEVYAAMTAGADAYCTKNIKMDRLIQVLEMVMEGAIWLDPAIAKIVSAAFPHKPDKKISVETTKTRQSHNPNMTEREQDVLNLLVEGRSNKEIADELHLSINTVKTHVRNIIDKMAVDSRTQVAVKALQLKQV